MLNKKQLEVMKAKEIRIYAQEQGIKNVSKYKKAELINKIVETVAERRKASIDRPKAIEAAKKIAKKDVNSEAIKCDITEEKKDAQVITPEKDSKAIVTVESNDEPYDELFYNILNNDMMVMDMHKSNDKRHIDRSMAPAEKLNTKSARIRYYLQMGYTRASIAKAMDCRYQMVRQIHVAMVEKEQAERNAENK